MVIKKNMTCIHIHAGIAEPFFFSRKRKSASPQKEKEKMVIEKI